MDEVYSIAELWMRSSLVVRRLAVNAKVATVMGSFLASSDTVESEGRQMKQYWITNIKKFKNTVQIFPIAAAQYYRQKI